MTTPVAPSGDRSAEMRVLADIYMQIQHLRVGIENMIYAALEGLDEPSPRILYLQGLAEQLLAMEEDIYKQMQRNIRYHPAWVWLNEVKGIGPTLATKLVGFIGDIGRFDTISKLWMYSGYGITEEGTIQKPKKGQKLNYNRKLKTTVYLCGDSFIKSRGAFRDVYDHWKDIYRRKKQLTPMVEHLGIDEEDIPDRTTKEGKVEWDKLIKATNAAAGVQKDEACWTDLHVDNAARRKMAKRFLACLYIAWREEEGMPVSEPYVLEFQPDEPFHTHTTKYEPWDYVEEKKKAS